VKCKNCGGDNESHNNQCCYCGSFDWSGSSFKIDPMKVIASKMEYLSSGFKTVGEVKKEHGIITELGPGQKLVPFDGSYSEARRDLYNAKPTVLCEIINESELPHFEDTAKKAFGVTAKEAVKGLKKLAGLRI